MENTYTFLRELAGSWGLIGLMGFYLCAVLYALRPSAQKDHEEAASAPFRNDIAPGVTSGQGSARTCGGDCAGCACGDLSLTKEGAA